MPESRRTTFADECADSESVGGMVLSVFRTPRQLLFQALSLVLWLPPEQEPVPTALLFCAPSTVHSFRTLTQRSKYRPPFRKPLK